MSERHQCAISRPYAIHVALASLEDRAPQHEPAPVARLEDLSPSGLGREERSGPAGTISTAHYGRPADSGHVGQVDDRTSVGRPGGPHVPEGVAKGEAGVGACRELFDPDGVYAILEHVYRQCLPIG